MWSPSGNRIAYLREHSGNSGIYAINTDGTHLRRLTRNSAHDWDPAWRPS